MRDLIFNTTGRKFTSAHYHVLFWTVFIIYEISLAAAIVGGFSHVADYFVHYLLNISLFYLHCYAVVGKRQLAKNVDYQRIAFFMLLELLGYLIISVWLNELFVWYGIPVIDPNTWSKRFLLSAIYRCFYFIGLATALRFALNLVENRERIHEYITQNLVAEREKQTLRAELIGKELARLRSQINPHLLFNSLNSVYNRIRKNDPSSAEYVMALAGLMQYAIRPERESSEVPLEWEVEYISNYLKIQTMRYQCEVHYSANIEQPELKIIPLLLISAVENVFQHGDLLHHEMPMIAVNESRGQLVLRTMNRIRADQKAGNSLGLSTTRRLLNGFYKGRHELQYQAQQNIFTFKLVINLT